MLIRMISLVSLAAPMVVLAQEKDKPAARKPAGEMKKIEVGGQSYDWYVAVGRGDSARKPAIVLIHEWWGLNDWIKQNADRFAALGYTTVAVDLYRGKVAKDADLAHELMRGLPEDQAIKDMRAAVTWLWEDSGVDRTRIGCIGWCMGGGYALTLALNDPRVTACAICYGRPVTDSENLKSLNASVLGIYGAEDRGISTETVKKFEDALKQASIKTGGIHVFPKVGHAFMNPENKQGYDAEAAAAAWKKIEGFFDAALQPSP